MLYNFLRFDNPFEFGHQYALSTAGQQIVQSQLGVHPFSLRYLWINFQVYFLEPALWRGRFPFVHDITAPSLPMGHLGIEHVFGVLPNTPLVWLALATPLAWRGRSGEAHCALRWFGISLVLLFGMCALTLGLFFAACLRYELEFLPALVLLAVLGILGLERTTAERPVWERSIRWGWGLLLVFSVSFNVFAMVEPASQHYVYRGVISNAKGQRDEAIVQFQKALKLQHDSPGGHNGLGAVLLKRGQGAEAIVHLEEGLRLQPDNSEAQNNLGVALFQVGQVSEAVGHYEQAVRLDPENPTAHYNLAVALLQQGKAAEAIGHLQQVLRVEPEDVEVHRTLGIARSQLGESLSAQGKWDEAIQQYEWAVEMKADNAQAHESLGVALGRQGRNAEAVVHYQKAVALEPQLASALNNLALILATETNAAIRNVEEAFRYAERASELTTNQVAGYLETLGVAYSESGRFNEAVQATERGAALARAAGNQELAAIIESRLKHYRERRPYHAIPKGTGP